MGLRMAIIALHKELQKKYVLLHYGLNTSPLSEHGQAGSLGTILCSDEEGNICAFAAEELQIVEIEGRKPGHWLERHSHSEQASGIFAHSPGQIEALAGAGTVHGFGAGSGSGLGGQVERQFYEAGQEAVGELVVEPCPACGEPNPGDAAECRSCGLALILADDVEEAAEEK